MLRNPLFCSFASLLIVLLTPFTNKADFLRHLIIFAISLISFSKLLFTVLSSKDARVTYVDASPIRLCFLCIPESAAVAANPNGIKTF